MLFCGYRVYATGRKVFIDVKSFTDARRFAGGFEKCV
jgi:hypothetical protein